MVKATKRLPLNERVIVIYDDGVNKGMFGRGEYVSLIDVREACTRENCENSDEHYTFDGQFFFQGRVVR